MFSNLQPVDKKTHKQLKFKAVMDYSFAAATVNCPLTSAEVVSASRHYPVVFPAANGKADAPREFQPMAVFALTPGSNPFVTKKGEWQAPFVPAFIRRYPFALTPLGQGGQYALMIDVDAPQLKKRGGEPLFDEHGKASPLLAKAQVFLKKYQQQIVATQQLMTELDTADVLVPYQLTVGSKGNQPRVVRGFRVVDMKKVAALDDATLARWVRNGLMAIIMAHRQSLNNVLQIAEMQPVSTEKAS